MNPNEATPVSTGSYRVSKLEVVVHDSDAPLSSLSAQLVLEYGRSKHRQNDATSKNGLKRKKTAGRT